MIFVTVGTVLPFDRLIRAVDQAAAEGLIGEFCFAQIGHDGYRPQHMAWAEVVDRDSFAEKVHNAWGLVAHAGTGTIFAALAARKPLLVMPRLSRLQEHVNDHQVHTAERFGALGHVLVAWDETQIPAKLQELRTFVPRPRVPRGEQVVECVRAFLSGVERQRRARRG